MADMVELQSSPDDTGRPVVYQTGWRIVVFTVLQYWVCWDFCAEPKRQPKELVTSDTSDWGSGLFWHRIKSEPKKKQTPRDFPNSNLTPKLQITKQQRLPFKKMNTRNVLVLTPSSDVQSQAGGAKYVSCCVCPSGGIGMYSKARQLKDPDHRDLRSKTANKLRFTVGKCAA